MKRLLNFLFPVVDLVLLPFVYPAAVMLKTVRRIGVRRLRNCKRALLQVGVFPIRDHYYEPLFNARNLGRPLNESRSLPGIDWNVRGQLVLLEKFTFADELRDIPRRGDKTTLHIDNGFFEAGDAEYLYNIIRLMKPRRIIEIGSGQSTLMAAKATTRNRLETPDYSCKHVCIEPYENRWLEKIGVTVIRQPVEQIERSFFRQLGERDLLFIDSSHMIKPQGDVLAEYLEILPSLAPGVIVHIHDIFSPRDYPENWVFDEVRLWNEQYLVEAFLTGNRDWKIIGLLNFLHHNHYEALKAKCPFLTKQNEPGSLYLQRVS